MYEALEKRCDMAVIFRYQETGEINCLKAEQIIVAIEKGRKSISIAEMEKLDI